MTSAVTSEAPFEDLLRRRLEAAADEPSWLQDLRRKGGERFRAAGFPGPAEEAWRFTSLKGLRKIDFDLAAADGKAASASSLVAEADAALVLAGGFVREIRSPEGNTGVRVESLARAAAGDAPPPLGSRVDLDRHRFSALNTALWTDGAHVRVAPGVEKPLLVHLLFLSPAEGEPKMTHPRVWIQVGEGSSVTVIEEYVGEGETASFTNTVTEIEALANTRVEHVRIQREGPAGFHIGSVSARLARNASLISHSLSVGGKLARIDIDILMDGEGAESILNGLYSPAGRQHVDHHTHVDHAAPHTSSREIYKGVLGGKARAVFNGRVIIRPGAQKVEAAQSNHNLLLSREALVNTNPELEIFADDVKAQHGATVGQIEEDHLFYLRSRGLSEAEARRMMISAFTGEMLDRVPVSSVQDGMRELLEDRF